MEKGPAIHRIKPVVVLTAALLISTGCSSFNRDWKAAAQKPASTGDISGAWDGQWLSDANGHHGRLRCILTKKEETVYDARFKARFWKIFSASYTVPLQIRPDTNGNYRLEGDSNLGALAGGMYRYSGEANSSQFKTQYSSKYDYGTFELKRPQSK